MTDERKDTHPSADPTDSNASTKDTGSNCGASGNEAGSVNSGFAGSPGIDLFGKLAAAFAPELDEDPENQGSQFGRALLLTADALDSFAGDLEVLAANQSDQRAALCKALSGPFREASEAMIEPGAALIRNAEAANNATEAADAVAAGLGQAVDVMQHYPATRNLGAVNVYSKQLALLARGYADFLDCLGDSDADTELSECYGYVHDLTAKAISVSFNSLAFGMIATIPYGMPVCTPACPYLGCTVYCSDHFRNARACLGWVRVPPGMFTGGGWENNCLWTVDTIKKTVCCCYANAWDLFWATNACACGYTTKVLATRIQVRKVFYVGRRVPAGPPKDFSESVTCP